MIVYEKIGDNKFIVLSDDTSQDLHWSGVRYSPIGGKIRSTIVNWNGQGFARCTVKHAQ